MMDQSTAVRGPGSDRPTHQPFRLVPPAITPVRASDLASGVVGQVRGRGRDEFREWVRQYLAGDSAATYTSFRRAFADCLRVLEDHRDDERERSAVAIPAFCSADYPKAIDGIGFDVHRFDVDSNTLAADVDGIASLPLDDVLALVAVNVLGYGSPMSELVDVCTEHDVFLIETLGYALGTSYRGNRLGTFGDCSVLNFQQGKPIPVGGGMAVGHNLDDQFGDAGRPAVGPNLGSLGGYSLFSHPHAYYAYRRGVEPVLRRALQTDQVSTHPESKEVAAYEQQPRTISNFQGRVGTLIATRLERHRRQRTANARYYRRELHGLDGIDLLSPIDGLTNVQFVRYPILADTPALRRAIRTALLEAGIQATRLYDWPSIDEHRFPGAARLQQGILTLPTHPYVSERDRERCVDVVTSVVR